MRRLQRGYVVVWVVHSVYTIQSRFVHTYSPFISMTYSLGVGGTRGTRFFEFPQRFF